MGVLTAKDLMQKNVAYVRPNMTVKDLIQFLNDEGIHGAPVVDGEGTVVGVVSRSDIFQIWTDEDYDVCAPTYHTMTDDGEYMDLPTNLSEGHKAEETEVIEIMSKSPLTATPETSVGELAERMLKEKVHRVIVTNDNKVVGIITSTDLLKAVSAYESEL
jgi:CBS domain-containing protein